MVSDLMPHFAHCGREDGSALTFSTVSQGPHSFHSYGSCTVARIALLLTLFINASTQILQKGSGVSKKLY